MESSSSLREWVGADISAVVESNEVISRAVNCELKYLLGSKLSADEFNSFFDSLQTPLWSQEHDDIRRTDCTQNYVGTPIYTAEGCTPGVYSSVIVVQMKHAHRFNSLARLAGTRLAVNSAHSWSGAVSMQRAVHDLVCPLEQGRNTIYFHPELVVTGSHRESLAALMREEAQCAIVDCVTWDILKRTCSAEVKELVVVCRTQPLPTPPIIVMQQGESSPTWDLIGSALFSAFHAVCTCTPHQIADVDALETLSNALETLGITGFLPVDSHMYNAALNTAARVAQHVQLQPWASANPPPPASDEEQTIIIAQLQSYGYPASAQEYFLKLDVSGYSFPISATLPSVQLWVGRGMQLAYGFNHEQALACFTIASRADTHCIMAEWGVAYCSGVNYNSELVDKDAMQRCCERARRIQALLDNPEVAITDLERALCNAVLLRAIHDYPFEDEGKMRAVLQESSGKYAEAMRALYEICLAQPSFAPGSLMADVTTLAVEAIMNLRPWKMWPSVDSHKNLKASASATLVHADTIYAQRALEVALTKYSPHPGLAHLHVHLMEMAPLKRSVQRACLQADVLRRQYPACGHLLHMASHIDIQFGDYSAAIDANLAGIQQDDNVARITGVGRNTYYHGYRVHNHHMLCYAAMFAGRAQLAIATAEECLAVTPSALIDAYIEYLDPYLTDVWHALIRFGRWQDILSRETDFDAKYLSRHAVALYAKALALASLGRVAEARDMQTRFESARAIVPHNWFLHNVFCTQLLEIASLMLIGEINYRAAVEKLPERRGEWTMESFVDVHGALAQLSAASRLEDGLPYDEPWGWMQPVRHAIGALALEQAMSIKGLEHLTSDAAKFLVLAETAYREDLEAHPRNIWALTGLHAILQERSSAFEEDAGTAKRSAERIEFEVISEQLRLARLEADSEISTITQSCFCAGRLNAPKMDSVSCCCD